MKRSENLRTKHSFSSKKVDIELKITKGTTDPSIDFLYAFMNVSSQSTIQSLVCKVLFGLFDMFCFGLVWLGLVCSVPVASWLELLLDSAAVSIFVVILFELTNTVFVN